MTEINSSEYLVQKLVEAGVKDVFCVTGGPISGLIEAFEKCSKIQMHFLLHEQSAGIAAEAYAANNLNPVAVLVTSGPGALNALTPLAAAWTNSSPVIFISGQVRSIDIANKGVNRQWGSQHIDTLEMVKGITKKAIRLQDEESFSDLDAALDSAKSNRMGPVWLEVPQDIQRKKFEFKVKPHNKNDAIIDNNKIEVFYSKAKAAKRPMVLVGNGCRSVSNEVLKFIERLDWPTQFTWPALDLMVTKHPLYAGRCGSIATWFANLAIQSCDFLLILGARIDLGQTAFRPENFAKQAEIFRVDIDSDEFRRLTGKKVTNLNVTIQDFIHQIDTKKVTIDKGSLNKWKNQIIKAKNELSFFSKSCQSGISMYDLLEGVSNNSSKFSTIVSGSSGTCTEQLMQAIEPNQGQRVQNSGGLGSMGFAIAGGIGAFIATKKPVLVMESDGSFSMNPQDLQFISSNKLPIKIIIMDSSGYKSIKLSQKRIGQKIVGASLESGVSLLDPYEMAKATGMQASKCTLQDDWEEILNSFLNDTNPGLLQVMVDPDEEAAPRVISKPNDKGVMETAPLEELWPTLDDNYMNTYFID